jgi:mRNA interferase RelE/StbE
MYQIKTTPTFDKDLRKLDRQVAKRIIKKIEWLASQSEIPIFSVKYLPKDLEGLQKYRVGDWRILFWLDRKKKEIVLYGVNHRKSVYKRF